MMRICEQICHSYSELCCCFATVNILESSGIQTVDAFYRSRRHMSVVTCQQKTKRRKHAMDDKRIKDKPERVRQFIEYQEKLSSYNIHAWKVFDRDHEQVIASNTSEHSDKYTPLDDRYKDTKVDLDYMVYSLITRTER
jgi:hypothetical protein